MQKLPSQFIVSIKPERYYKQGITHCGAFAVKAILSAYGKDDGRQPSDYHPTFIGKITGVTLSADYWSGVLRSFGLSAETHTADRHSAEEKIKLLKHLLSQNNPVMIRIGNGYDSSGKYHKFPAKIIGHWITLWGYDDLHKSFYIYDPYLALKKYAVLPTGNTTRTYAEILRDWRRPFLSLVTGKSVYIKVCSLL